MIFSNINLGTSIIGQYIELNKDTYTNKGVVMKTYIEVVIFTPTTYAQITYWECRKRSSTGLVRTKNDVVGLERASRLAELDTRNGTSYSI